MGELVGDDIGDELLLVLCRGRRIDEQQALAERDAAEVLHRSGREVGQREQVDLVARVGDAVVVLEPAQAERADLEPEPGEVAFARHVHDAQRDASDVDRLGDLERTDDERRQVGRHEHRVGETDRHLLAGRRRDRAALDLGPVRDGQQLGFDHERDAEHRLEVGLVPAGERPPAIGGLHLRRRDDLLVAVGVAERAAIEAAQLVVEHTGERDLDGVLAGHEVARRPDEQPFGVVVESMFGRLAVDEAPVDRRARPR